MSILLKDFKYETIVHNSGSTPGTDGYTSTNTGTSSAGYLSYYYIPDGWSQLPSGQWITEEGSLVVNQALTEYGLYFPEGFVGDAPGDNTSAKGIYLATPVQENDLMKALYPNDWDGTVSDNVAIAYHHQIVWYQGQSQLGLVRFVYADGSYLAFWLGAAGFGLYRFVGYDASNPPTQTLAYTPVVEPQISNIVNTDPFTTLSYTTLPDVNGVFELGSGYDTPSVTWDNLYTDGTGTFDDYFVAGVDYSVTTTMPAQEATTGTSESLTYTEILKLTNSGWNSWARSIEPLALGKFIKFTTASGVTSACVVIAGKGMEGEGVARFSHGIICDSSGVRIYENGAMVKTLYATQTVLTELRIYRQSANEIVYMAITGTSSVVHTSTVPAPLKILPLYAYGFLYTAGDRLTSASITTGDVQYGSV